MDALLVIVVGRLKLYVCVIYHALPEHGFLIAKVPQHWQ